MKKKNKMYEFLPHTADVKFKAYGKDLEGAFSNAAYALTDVMISHDKVRGKEKRIIIVESENLEALLYDFLEQFLILVDSYGFLLRRIDEIKIKKLGKGGKIKKGNKFALSAEALGDEKIENYKIDTHIKAVTYEEMTIKIEKKGFALQVVLDI